MKQKIFFIVMLCFPFLVLELVFRLLPVSYPPYILDVDEKQPVARFQKSTNYLWSKGWNFNIVSKKKTNNFGYVNDYDYVRSKKNPLMVIIGDSYVEAHQLSNDKSVSGILGEKVINTGRVYSIGLSGAPLSQYLAFTEYAKDELSADSLVFVIVGNDFDESLLKYKPAPRFHFFVEQDGRYILNRKDVSLRFAGNVPFNVPGQRLKDSKTAVDEFFSLLPIKSGINKNNILFVIDGIRPSLYSDQGLEEAKNSFFSHMRLYFIKTAKERGYEVKDMQSVFIKRNRFDGSTDT